MTRFPEPDEIIQEALASVEMAVGGIRTLHIGPLDYNIATTVDSLLVAVRLLEQLGRDMEDGAR